MQRSVIAGRGGKWQPALWLVLLASLRSVRPALQRGKWRPALWLALLGLICLAQLLAHTGERNGLYQSSRPVYGENAGLSADGYAMWLDGTPILADANWFVKQAEIFLGQRGPEHSGPYDQRAGYGWLVALLIPAAGYEGAFLVVNLASWWAPPPCGG